MSLVEHLALHFSWMVLVRRSFVGDTPHIVNRKLTKSLDLSSLCWRYLNILSTLFTLITLFTHDMSAMRMVIKRFIGGLGVVRILQCCRWWTRNTIADQTKQISLQTEYSCLGEHSVLLSLKGDSNSINADHANTSVGGLTTLLGTVTNSSINRATSRVFAATNSSNINILTT